METLTCGSPKRKVFADILNNMTINEPSSPMSNLKLLTDVAIFINNQSKENETRKKTKKLPKNVLTEQESETKCLKNSKSRKEKSLSMLCDKFLEFYPLNVDPSTRVVISIDRLANLLCTERRRVYDIINILESLQMTVKLCKNRYEWYGCKQLHVTLAHLKGFAVKLGLHKQVRFPEVKVEDFMETSLEISKVFEAVTQPLPFKSSTPPYPDTRTETSARPLSVMSMGQPPMDVVTVTVSSEDYIRSRYQPILPKKVELLSGKDSEDVGSTEDLWGDLDMERDIRDCNSLGVLCQKFVMLFLLTNKRQLLTLELASRILVGGVMDRLVNDITGRAYTPDSPPFQGSVKTKVRRLYDIANVLTSLRLICKVQASNLKKPAFRYTGPAVDAVGLPHLATLVQVTRQSMLGPHHPSLMKSHGVLVLLPDCQTRWMVVPSPTQEPIKCYHRKRKHFSGPTDIALKMPRTRSDNTLTHCKSQTRSGHKYADHCSLNSILNVAEMELIKIKKEESLPQDRLTSQGTDRYIAPFYTKKRPFSRHHSESCVTESMIQCDNEAPKIELSNKTSNSIINSLSNDDVYKNTLQHSVAKLDEMEMGNFGSPDNTVNFTDESIKNGVTNIYYGPKSVERNSKLKSGVETNYSDYDDLGNKTALIKGEDSKSQPMPENLKSCTMVSKRSNNINTRENNLPDCVSHPSGQEMQMVRKLVKLTPLVSRQKVCSSKSYLISNTEHMPSYSGKMLFLDRNDSENSKSVRVAKSFTTIDLSNVARSIESRSMKPNDLTAKSMKLLIKGKTIELTKLVKVGNIMELINPVQCEFT